MISAVLPISRMLGRQSGSGVAANTTLENGPEVVSAVFSSTPDERRLRFGADFEQASCIHC